MRDESRLGDKLLPKIIHAVSQTIITTRRGMAPLDHYVRYKATQDIIDKIGHEVAEHYGPIADTLLAHDDGTLNPVVRQFLIDSRSGNDQAKAIVGLVSGAGQSAISTFLSNELAPLTYRAVSVNPNLEIDPQTAAQAATMGILDANTAALYSARQGFGAEQFQTLVQIAEQYPDIADALDMRRRGIILDAELDDILLHSSVPPTLQAAWRGMINIPLSIADAALAYLRSDITLDAAVKIAADNGYTAEQLNVFIGNTGEPLGLEQLLEAYRRGFIDQATLERGIKQSRTRNEWIATAIKLRYSPMSVADAVNAVVQNHLAQADAQVISDQNGLDPTAFPVLVETAGEPLSRTEMSDLYNRGLVTQADVDQALRESRLKNKYINDAFALHVRLLEPRILSSAVEVGAVSHADAIKRALEYGFSSADAQILVSEGSNRKLLTYRERVVTAAESLYEENAITDATFKAIAQAMGFESTEAEFIYQSAEYRRQAKIVTSAISAIRSKYIGHHIVQNEAIALLDALGIPSGQRDALIGAWDVEAAANVKTLTTAQVVKAVKNSLITPDDGMTRLVADGYSQTDATLLLEGA